MDIEAIIKQSVDKGFNEGEKMGMEKCKRIITNVSISSLGNLPEREWRKFVKQVFDEIDVSISKIN